jgi:RNA polymerase sigma-70 factor (ECF subfamily)
VPIVRERDFDEAPELSLRDQEPDPERSADSRLKNERIHEALANLPETFREAVVLRDVQGLPYEDICEILGQQIGTVKSRIFRGRSILKTMLKDIYD